MYFCRTPGPGVDFTFVMDNKNINNNNNRNSNPHLNFVKGTVLGDKDQVVGIRDKTFSGVRLWRPSFAMHFFLANSELNIDFDMSNLPIFQVKGR